MVFGEEMRRRRRALGLSLQGLADLAYYSKGHLSRIENGRSTPQPDCAWAIDGALRAGGELAGVLPDLPRRSTEVLPPSGLPHDPPHFVGRGAELTRLVAELSAVRNDPGHAGVCAINGIAGVGKTALAIKVARALSRRFSQGILFLDLHGHTADRSPMTSADALAILLGRLGLQAPADADERAVLFGHHLGLRQVLLVLDNAVSAEQVRPFIPRTSAARLLVTSRARLSSLDEASHLRLGPLSEEDGAELLGAAVPGAHEESLVRLILELGGGLPLALTILAARVGDQSLPDLATSIRGSEDRIGEISDGERSLVSTFETSFRALPDEERRFFALLGVHGAVLWNADRAAALVGVDVSTAARSLERLARARLIEARPGRRFQFHDLVGEFARRKARSEVSAETRAAAIRRLLARTLDLVDRADSQIVPDRYRPPVLRTAALAPFTDAAEWLATEQADLVALCGLAHAENEDASCWKLAALLRGHFFQTKQWDDWIRTHEWALASALRDGDRDGEAMTRNNLGLALMELGRLDEADEHFRVVRGLPQRNARMNALANHASILYYRGRYEESLRDNHEALAFYRAEGIDRNVGITLRSIALVELELGLPEQAIRHLTEALEIFDPLSLDAVMALNCLGEICLRSGDPAEAEVWLNKAVKAIEASRERGSPYERARALRGLGEAASLGGRSAEAREHWRLALDLLTDLGAPERSAVADLIAGV
ncbi:tetratricopeptide repeat protein [Actinocorallia sp. API 0066]|uniref:tetratricopeptide repeat protein n=1 Tax=Actinocorallia sp. API 0066 TaxID=2896846 RepID=UPI001E33AD70|nr:tetratricopeptide repeat protein [Actinocorallia sp. API 0066]MCD0448022.1 tetratricopeptide repeat protein [Actinocorallia sp. API 0066]